MVDSATQADWLSPDWLLAGFDARTDLFHFARVDRETYSQSAFLDHRISPVPSEVTSAAGAELRELLSRADLPAAGWILHTAFCASTLLASCLNRGGQTLVLKEPMVLSRLAQAQRQSPAATWDTTTRTIASLLRRHYRDEQVVIKPSNFANRAASAILADSDAAGPNAAVILMSNSLPELLISVIKKREEAERLMPQFLASLLQDSDYAEQLDLPQQPPAELLQQAFLFWHCQRYQLQQFRQQSDLAITGITMAGLFADPVGTLTRAVNALQLPLTEQDLVQANARHIQGRHAKQPGQTYSPEHHRREAQELQRRHRSELDAVLQWGQPLLRQLPPQPLHDGEDPLAA